jgi:ring-1,2-phenylacetyl-CoA epoxidase subunit PaaD
MVTTVASRAGQRADAVAAQRSGDDLDRARAAAATVTDPEIPVLTIADLGILRGVSVSDDAVDVVITPTYSGCPAMDTIRTDLEHALHAAGFATVHVHTVHAPAWTTDWMTTEGRDKLREFGIAPPGARAPGGPIVLTLGRRAPEVRCPQCGAPGREQSRFGSTSCKSLYVCTACAEPFDHFKAI